MSTNRGILRGIGMSPPMYSMDRIQGGFIQGPYPSQPWTARQPRPTFKGTVRITAPHRPNATSSGQALLISDTAQSVNLPQIRNLLGIVDGAEVPIFTILNAGGGTIYGDTLKGVANANVGTPSAGIDGRTIPAGLFFNVGGNPARMLAGNTTPTGGALTFYTSRVGDIYWQIGGAAGARLFFCTVAGSPGTWVAATGV